MSTVTAYSACGILLLWLAPGVGAAQPLPPGSRPKVEPAQAEPSLERMKQRKMSPEMLAQQEERYAKLRPLQRKPPERLIPLTDMGPNDRYEGEEGGLYGGGRNTPPPALQRAAETQLGLIRPLDAQGKPAADGIIAFVSLSMSNATQEFRAFKHYADVCPEKSSKVVLVDCAQGSQDMMRWTKEDGQTWTVTRERLERANVSPNQVQAVWMKPANSGPTGSFQEHARKLEQDTLKVLQIARRVFPNLRIVYLSSRSYGGYATPGNPEPYAYESAFVVRWLIQRQTKGDAELDLKRVPLLLWGPYLWADGRKGRKIDGLVWERSDFIEDGTHPSETGRLKVTDLMLEFFTTNSYAKRWFVGSND